MVDRTNGSRGFLKGQNTPVFELAVGGAKQCGIQPGSDQCHTMTQSVGTSSGPEEKPSSAIGNILYFGN